MRNVAWLVVALGVVGFGCEEPSGSELTGLRPDRSGRAPGEDRSELERSPGDGSLSDPSPAPPSPSGVPDAGPPPSYPSATKKIKDLTGPGTSAAQFGVGGTDLGIPIRQPNGKIAYIFGDTFEQNTVGGPGWRSPVLLRSEPGGLDAGITFTSAAGGAYAKQILSYDHNHPDWSTWLPSDAITIGDRMYLHYMVNQGLGNVRWSEIAYSDDNGETWTPSGVRWDGGDSGGLRQLWTWERGDDGYVYVLSTKFSRTEPILLYRVPEGRLLDKGAYEPWGFKDGAWAWGNPATVVLTGAFGEMCLRKIEGKWVLSWFNAGDYDLTIKVFDAPTSNLYTAKTYKPIKGTAWGFESDTRVAQLYGGYIHPDSTLHELHIILSQWNTQTNWPYRSMQFVTGVD